MLSAVYSYIRSADAGVAVFALRRAASIPADYISKLADNGNPWAAKNIAEIAVMQQSSTSAHDTVFVVVDAAASAAAEAPGWAVRNVLALLSVKGLAPMGHADVLCLRGRHMQDDNAIGNAMP